MPLLLLTLNVIVPIRRQSLAVLVLLLVLPLIRFLTLKAHPGATLDEVRRLILLPFHTHADGLLTGVLIAWLAVLHPRFVAPLPLLRNLPLPAALAAAGLVLRGFNPRLFGFTGLALIFGGLTWFVLSDKSPFSRLAGLRVFYITSRLSYGMYLNHFLVLPPCIALVASTPLNPYVSFSLGYPFTIVCSMAVAAITFVVIESPFLQLREQWLMRRKSRAPQARPDPSIAA